MTMTTSSISHICAADRDFLGSAEGFFSRYIHNLAYYPSCADAYERTEAQYNALTGRNRYKSYDSFRSAYSQFCRQQKTR